MRPAAATTPTTTPAATPAVLEPPPPPDGFADDVVAKVGELDGDIVTTTVWPAAVLVEIVAIALVEEGLLVGGASEDEDPVSVPAVPVPVVYTDQNPSPPPVSKVSTLRLVHPCAFQTYSRLDRSLCKGCCISNRPPCRSRRECCLHTSIHLPPTDP